MFLGSLRQPLAPSRSVSKPFTPKRQLKPSLPLVSAACPALFRFDSSYPPSGDTPEYPLYLTLWANYLVARDLHYQVSMDPPNNTCGVELYSPHFASRKLGLIQGVLCPIMYTTNEKFILRKIFKHKEEGRGEK